MKTTYAEQYRQIGLKIAYYRRLRGFTQEQLAERIDRSPEAPNILKAVSLDTLFDIATVLEVPPYKFLLFEEP